MSAARRVRDTWPVAKRSLGFRVTGLGFRVRICEAPYAPYIDSLLVWSLWDFDIHWQWGVTSDRVRGSQINWHAPNSHKQGLLEACVADKCVATIQDGIQVVVVPHGIDISRSPNFS